MPREPNMIGHTNSLRGRRLVAKQANRYKHKEVLENHSTASREIRWKLAVLRADARKASRWFAVWKRRTLPHAGCA